MCVLGAHSSSPSHTLKRTVRRPAKSPPTLVLSVSRIGAELLHRLRRPAFAGLPASLGRSRLAEVTRLTDSRKARTGLRRAGLFILGCGRHRSRARLWATLPPAKTPSQFDFARTSGWFWRANNRHCRKSRPLRSEPTSLWLVLNIIQRPGPEGHPDHQKLHLPFLCGVCMIRLTAACI